MPHRSDPRRDGDAGREPDRYRLAASVYDFATWAWSGGAIWRTRAHALRYVAPDATVLIPGMGTGRLALEAAKAGGDVLALDLSSAMLKRAQRRALGFTDAPLRLRMAKQDIMDLPDAPLFDVVVAEHFLNVFRPDQMPKAREKLLGLTAPGGVLVVADFSPMPAQGSRLGRGLQSVHHVLPLGGCALLTRNAMHPIYHHARDLAGRTDVVLEATYYERSFLVGPRWFCTWVFRKLCV